MKESIKRAIPMIQNAATIAAIAGAGVITFFAIKDRNEGPRRTVTFQGIPYTFGSDASDKKSEGTEHYICPPFGGQCKSFNTEEQKSTVRNRV
ncbi:MAG TPA: hypothetical protein VGV92_07375 [Gammaproteobacteria bacterium]|nr:hypothetical protein [Gammaproteobacteria bacterium]